MPKFSNDMLGGAQMADYNGELLRGLHDANDEIKRLQEINRELAATVKDPKASRHSLLDLQAAVNQLQVKLARARDDLNLITYENELLRASVRSIKTIVDDL